MLATYILARNWLENSSEEISKNILYRIYNNKARIVLTIRITV